LAEMKTNDFQDINAGTEENKFIRDKRSTTRTHDKTIMGGIIVSELTFGDVLLLISMLFFIS
jgi:hypothetical protein